MIYPLIIVRYIILFVIDPEKPLWGGINKLISFDLITLETEESI